VLTVESAARRWEAGRPLGFPSPGRGDDPLWRATIALGVMSLLVPVLVVAILGATLLSLPLSGGLPPARPGLDSQITRVYDATGAEIANFHRFETSLPVAREDIPDVLKQAAVASEDRRFYEHKGIDSRGILRAFWRDLQGGHYSEGASTITQQYVRLAYTGDQRTISRKVREAVLAGRLERKLSKDEILYRYLSRVYFGSGAYGAGAAAESYFHKAVRDLTLSEAALLAGVLPSPSTLDPRVNPSGAEERRQTVLDKMAEQGRITPQQLSEATAQRVAFVTDRVPAGEPVTLIQPVRDQQSKYPWFTDYVRRYLVARFGDEKVYQGGLQVHTSLDPRTQAQAEGAVANALKGTQAPLEMAMTVIDPQTGLVKAMVGGRDFAKSQVNLALGNCVLPPDAPPTQPATAPVCISGGGSGRQPGSSFKPFTLAKAFESGMSDKVTYRGPGVYTIPNCRGTGCTIHNVESGGYGYITLRQATAYSVNTVYGQLVQDVGVKETAEMAHRLGLTTVNPQGVLPTGEPYGPSLTLGAAEVAPLDMAAAFGVFAARGMQFPASPVVTVKGPQGDTLEDNSHRAGKRVLASDVADRVTDVLKDVIGYGTGKAADIGRPNGTAGKTGTSENYSDAWFVGYTPQLVSSVWMGYANAQKPLVNIKGLPQVYGGTIPAQTWHDFMTEALADAPPRDFAPPPPPPPPPTTVPQVTTPPVYTPTPPGGETPPDQGTGLPPSPPVTESPIPPPPAGEPPVIEPPQYVPPQPPAQARSSSPQGPCITCLLIPGR
jgi:penicillin-binding protein 1A